MSTVPIKRNKRPLTLHKASVQPNFNSKTVLVDDVWDYVEMWLKRNGSKEARFYWNQSKAFYQATHQLNNSSAPLTAYYCFLNAVKTLFEVKKIDASDHHGVTGYDSGNYSSLANEHVKFKAGGILPKLCEYLKEPTTEVTYDLKQIFYNLPYMHRAYCLTYANTKELFIPVNNPTFVRKNNSSEAWITFKITDEKYQDQHTLNKLPNKLERDMGFPDEWVIRVKKRFKWKTQGEGAKKNLERLGNYHLKSKKHLTHITGPKTLWYFKRNGLADSIDRSQLTLAFAAMHRLSELARYNPIRLSKHFDSQHNWLLSEFISISTAQFMDTISSEITGMEFLKPGRRKNNGG